MGTLPKVYGEGGNGGEGLEGKGGAFFVHSLSKTGTSSIVKRLSQNRPEAPIFHTHDLVNFVVVTPRGTRAAEHPLYLREYPGGATELIPDFEDVEDDRQFRLLLAEPATALLREIALGYGDVFVLGAIREPCARHVSLATYQAAVKHANWELGPGDAFVGDRDAWPDKARALVRRGTNNAYVALVASSGLLTADLVARQYAGVLGLRSETYTDYLEVLAREWGAAIDCSELKTYGMCARAARGVAVIVYVLERMGEKRVASLLETVAGPSLGKSREGNSYIHFVPEADEAGLGRGVERAMRDLPRAHDSVAEFLYGP